MLICLYRIKIKNYDYGSSYSELICNYSDGNRSITIGLIADAY